MNTHVTASQDSAVKRLSHSGMPYLGHNLRFLVMLIVLCVSVSLKARAWQAPGEPAPQGPSVPTPSSTASPAASDHLQLSGIAYCGAGPASKNEAPTACRLGDTVFVGFTNLREWMSNPANNVSGVTLVLNGRLMKGLPSRGPDQTYSGLQFD